MYHRRAAVVQAIAGRGTRVRCQRKVRTPQGSAPGNARAGQPDGKWHRKYTARRSSSPQGRERRRVRVKRCGKSAPRGRQRTWQAKPRTEQDQIGRRSRTARPKPPGRLLEAVSNAGPRGMIARPLSPQGIAGRQNSAYRTTAALPTRTRRHGQSAETAESMAFYLVTGGAGFIGSHMVEALRRRGDTGPGGRQSRRLASAPTSRTSTRWSSSRATWPTRRSRWRGRGRRLRPSPGGDPVGAAIGRGSPHLQPRQHRRHAEPARRGARCRRQARRVRRQFLGVRQRRDPPQAGGHADGAALALRAAEARRRAVHADVHRSCTAWRR